MKKLLFVLMAAGMLFACQSAQDKMNDAADAVADTAGEVADATGDMAGTAGNAVADAAGEVVDAISGSYDEIKGALGANAMKLDASSSALNWVGSKAIGDKHEGTIGFSEGMLSITDGKASGVFTVDMNSMKNTDLDADGGAKLIGHLASPDFFDTANNPTATLVIDNVVVGDGGAFKTMGKLNLKGKVSYNEVVGNISKTDAGAMAIVNMTFDRTDHDVRYGSGKFFDNLGDKVINDNIVLNGTLNFNN